MINKNFAIAVAIFTGFAGSVAADECPKKFQQVAVSGIVDTQNVSAEMQVGTIDMQLTSIEQGSVVFDKVGAVVGQITEQGIDPETGLPFARLDHVITFSDKDKIATNGDFATIYGDPTTGEPVPVVEVISDFKGKKTFKKATGTILANGYLNSRVEYNSATGEFVSYNFFELSGSLCIKE